MIYANRFNIGLLTTRLAGATRWLQNFPRRRIIVSDILVPAQAQLLPYRLLQIYRVSVPLFPEAGVLTWHPYTALQVVKAPVLLIVGSLDTDVLRLNREAFNQLRGDKELEVVDGATHLFEEPGKLDEVAKLATAWFEKYLNPVSSKKSLM